MASEFKKRCPRCGGKDIGTKYVRLKDTSGRSIFCNECGLKFVNRYVDYLYWRWNRPKEDQAAYLIPLVNKHPDYVAFCSRDLIAVWGDTDKLCEFVSVESKREVVCVPAIYNSDGVLLKGL